MTFDIADIDSSDSVKGLLAPLQQPQLVMLTWRHFRYKYELRFILGSCLTANNNNNDDDDSIISNNEEEGISCDVNGFEASVCQIKFFVSIKTVSLFKTWAIPGLFFVSVQSSVKTNNFYDIAAN